MNDKAVKKEIESLKKSIESFEEQIDQLSSQLDSLIEEKMSLFNEIEFLEEKFIEDKTNKLDDSIKHEMDDILGE